MELWNDLITSCNSTELELSMELWNDLITSCNSTEKNFSWSYGKI